MPGAHKKFSYVEKGSKGGLAAPFLLPLPKKTPLYLLHHQQRWGCAKLSSHSPAPQRAILGIDQTPPRLVCVISGEADGTWLTEMAAARMVGDGCEGWSRLEAVGRRPFHVQKQQRWVACACHTLCSNPNLSLRIKERDLEPALTGSCAWERPKRVQVAVQKGLF